MNPGPAFKVEMPTGALIRVFYTREFVRRYHTSERNRPSVENHGISEAVIEAKIREALPTIVEYAEGDLELEGAIKSRSLKLNMSFAASPTRDGLSVRIKNAMVKVGYRPTSLRDYVIDVNPVVEVRFARGIGLDVRERVALEIIPLATSEELEDGVSYHLADPQGEVEFWVERRGDMYYIDEADWSRDVVMVHVP